jgi:outer membrane protein assembly factor BamA/autotransporter translocation and assembly factor TamB
VRSRLYRLALAGLALAGVGLIAALLVHTAPVRARLLGWLSETMRVRYGLRLEVAAFHYNFATRSIRLGGVQVTAAGPGTRAGTPLFYASSIEARLSWSVLRGRLALDTLELLEPRLALVQDAEGRWNWPSVAGWAPRAARPQVPPIGRLSVRSGSVALDAVAAGVAIRVADLAIDAGQTERGLSGTFGAPRGAQGQLGTTPLSLSRAEGRFLFDGATLTLDGVRLDAADGLAELSGRVRGLPDAPRVEGRYRLALRPDRLAARWPPLSQLVDEIQLAGNIRGPLRGPIITAEAVGRLAGGVLEARGHLSPQEADGPRGTLEATYRNVALDRLLAAVAAPVRLEGRIDGRLEAAWTAARPQAIRLTASATIRGSPAAVNRTRRRAAPPAVSGRAVLALDHGRVELRHVLRLDRVLVATGRARGRLDFPHLSATPLAGTVDLDVADLRRALPVLGAAGLDLSPLAAAGLAGDLRAALTLEGTLGRPRIRGQLVSAALRTFTSGPSRLEARLTVDRELLRFEALELREASNWLRAQGRLRFDPATVAIEATAAGRDPARWLRALPVPWRPAGSFLASGTVTGRLGAPRVALAVDGEGVMLAGQRFDRVAARLAVADGTVVVEEATFLQPPFGRLRLSGQYWPADGAYRVAAQVNAVELAGAGPRGSESWRLRLSGQFHGEGTMRHPGGRGEFLLRDLAWPRVHLPEVRAKLTLADDLARLAAQADSPALWMEGALRLGAPYRFTVRATVDEGDLARWLEGPAGPLVTGRIVARLEASGTVADLAALDAELAVDQLELRAEATPFALTRPARLRYAGGDLAVSGVELRTGHTRLTAAGLLATTAARSALDLALEGTLADFAPLGRILTADLARLDGTAQIALTVGGSLARPRIRGRARLEGGVVGLRGLPEITELRLEASLAEGVLTVERFHARWQEAVAVGSLRLPLPLVARWLPAAVREALPAEEARLHLEARIAPLTAAALRPWLERRLAAPIELEASAALVLEAEALSLEGARGELVFDSLQLALAGVQVAQRRPTRLQLAAGRLVVADWEWAGARSALRVTGGVEVHGGGRLDVQTHATIDLLVLGALMPGVATGGRATIDVRADGPWAAPTLTGALVVSEGELRLREPRLIVSGVRGVALLDREGLVVRGATGLLNGGPVRIDGALRREGLAVRGGNLELLAEHVALTWPPGLRAEATGELRLIATPDGATLKGRVILEGGAYREPVLLTRQLLAARRPTPTAPAASSRRARVALDIAVATADELVVDNNVGRFGLAADLRLAGTLEEPELSGRVSLSEGGRVFLGGREYRLERGTLDFVDPRRLAPAVDLAVRTRVGGADITFSVHGPLDRLTTDLAADDPTLSDTDIVSLLVTGQRASESGLAEIGTVRDQMLSYLSGDLLGLLGHQVGFDVVRLERGVGEDLFGPDPALVAGETDPAMRLSLTKRLGARVELVLSQNLREAGRVTWIGTYRPERTLELRAVARDDESRALALSQRLALGEPPRRTGAGTPAPRIVDVTISAAPGVAEREVRDRLRLGPGDRFDFFRWQADRERLEQWYRQRGFLEARISAERDSPTEDTVRLRYRIDRGPRTVWQFEGYVPSARLRADLDALWAASTFDRFLLEEVEARVRRELAGDGFLRADVRADLASAPEADPPRKTLRLQVTRGPRTPDRRIVFRGNAHLSTATLDEELRLRGLDVTAWLMPAELEEALRDRYRSEGLLAARVTVGSPSFDGPRAVLPVEIAEGPVFRVASVRIEGARAKRSDEIARLFGVAPGTPYRPARIEEGQRLVERAYRQAGYHQIRTRVLQQIDELHATVSLTLVVEEGPRQILDSVLVEAAAARRDLVTRLLAARPGSPIDPEAWYQARKRLYDTGLFSRVDIHFEPLEPSPLDRTTEHLRARVSVAEQAPSRLRYGVQVGDRRSVDEAMRTPTWGAVADFERRHLLGGALTAGLSGRYEADRWLARSFARTQRVGSAPLTSSLYLTRSREHVRPEGALAFVTDRTTLTAQQDARVGTWGRATYGYSFARDRTFAPAAHPDDPLAQGIVLHVARLTGAFTADRRDDPFDPTRGWFHASTVEYAAGALGSDLRFVKYLLQHAAFASAGRMVLAGNLRVGAARGLGQELIGSERFRAGGSTSVRGYGTDTLGPLDVFGEPAGGNALVVVNGELRVRLARRWRGVAFLDAGNVFAHVADLSLADLKVGVGFGTRLDTPVGLVRVDVGVPLARPPRGDRRARWYVSLGHAF